MRDNHIGPHPINDAGGCHCICDDCCTLQIDNRYRCTCKRCSQDCRALGRYGTPEEVEKERAMNEPIDAKPAKRWYLK